MDFVSIRTPIHEHFAGCANSSMARPRRSAGFQICRIADFQIGWAGDRAAGLETRDTADLEVIPVRHGPWGEAVTDSSRL
jgi:hypothetical protein